MRKEAKIQMKFSSISKQVKTKIKDSNAEKEEIETMRALSLVQNKGKENKLETITLQASSRISNRKLNKTHVSKILRHVKINSRKKSRTLKSNIKFD